MTDKEPDSCKTSAPTEEIPIQDFERVATDLEASRDWRPVSDRRIRVGIAGYGVCNFGAAFQFQDHLNVAVAAVAELEPDKRAQLAKACRCPNAYATCEELIADESAMRCGELMKIPQYTP